MKFLIDESEVLESNEVTIDKYGRAFISTKLANKKVRILVLKADGGGD
jgi:hypothetical protein